MSKAGACDRMAVRSKAACSEFGRRRQAVERPQETSAARAFGQIEDRVGAKSRPTVRCKAAARDLIAPKSLDCQLLLRGNFAKWVINQLSRAERELERVQRTSRNRCRTTSR
jgi:hypothetical protein